MKLLLLSSVLILTTGVITAQDCNAAFGTAMDCFDGVAKRESVLNKRNVLADQRRLDMMTNLLKTCYKTANKAVSGEKRQQCDISPFDPEAVAAKECLKEVNGKLGGRIKRCIEKGGDAGFSLKRKSNNANRGRGAARRGNRKNQQKDAGDYTLAEFNARKAASNCEEKLGIENLEHEISLCYNKELEKNARRFPKRANKGALFAFLSFDNECGNYKKCSAHLNLPSQNDGKTCQGAICDCYEEVRTDTEFVTKYKDCVLEKVPYSTMDDEQAATKLLELTRTKLPFCTPSTEDNVCDPEKGVYADVGNSLSNDLGPDNKIVTGLKALADGGGQKVIVDLFSKVFNEKVGSLGNLAKLFGNGAQRK